MNAKQVVSALGVSALIFGVIIAFSLIAVMVSNGVATHFDYTPEFQNCHIAEGHTVCQ